MTKRVVARDHIKPECREAALKLIQEMVECTRKEEGNISYNYCQDRNNPDYFAMIECWESDEASKKHSESEHFRRIFPQLKEMFAEPSRVEIYTEVF